MITTETDLANYALAHLGEARISAISGTDAVSRRCNEFVGPTIDEVLCSTRWNCATKRATLSELASTPEHGLGHQFQLPGDFLRLLELNGEEWEGSDQYFERENGQVLVTDEDSAKIRYLARIGVAEMDPLLKECVALKLAAKLAVPLKGKEEAQAQQLALYNRALKRAAATDAVETKGREGKAIHRLISNSPLIRSRYRGRYTQTRYFNRYPTW